jgi:hypothetical protein
MSWIGSTPWLVEGTRALEGTAALKKTRRPPYRLDSRYSMPARGVTQGRLTVSAILGDLLLFSCLAAFITGVVVAVASLLS